MTEELVSMTAENANKLQEKTDGIQVNSAGGCQIESRGGGRQESKRKKKIHQNMKLQVWSRNMLVRK